MNKPEPVSIISLASDLVSIEDSKVDNNRARVRPKISNISDKNNNEKDKGFDSIDLDGLIAAS